MKLRSPIPVIGRDVLLTAEIVHLIRVRAQRQARRQELIRRLLDWPKAVMAGLIRRK